MWGQHTPGWTGRNKAGKGVGDAPAARSPQRRPMRHQGQPSCLHATASLGSCTHACSEADQCTGAKRRGSPHTGSEKWLANKVHCAETYGACVQAGSMNQVECAETHRPTQVQCAETCGTCVQVGSMKQVECAETHRPTQVQCADLRRMRAGRQYETG